MICDDEAEHVVDVMAAAASKSGERSAAETCGRATSPSEMSPMPSQAAARKSRCKVR